jgi:ankyrin repeat protein
VASFYARTDIVKLLIEKGADINAKGNSGGTALGTAKKLGLSDIAKILQDAGAKE